MEDLSKYSTEELEAMLQDSPQPAQPAQTQAPQATQEPASDMPDLSQYSTEDLERMIGEQGTAAGRIGQMFNAGTDRRDNINPLEEAAKGAGRAAKAIGGAFVGLGSGAVRLAGTPVRALTGWDGLHRVADAIDSGYEDWGSEALASELPDDDWGRVLGGFGEKMAGTAGTLGAMAAGGGLAKLGAAGKLGAASKAAHVGGTLLQGSLPWVFGNDAAVRTYDTAKENGSGTARALGLAGVNGLIHFAGFKLFENQSLNKMLGMPKTLEAMMPTWANAAKNAGANTFSGLANGVRTGMFKYILAERAKGALKAGGIMGLQNFLSSIPTQLAEGQDVDWGRAAMEGAEGLGEGALMEGLMGGAAMLKTPKAAREFIAKTYYRDPNTGLLNTPEGRMFLMKQNPEAQARVVDIVEHGGKVSKAELDAACLPPDMTEEEVRKFAKDWKHDLEVEGWRKGDDEFLGDGEDLTGSDDVREQNAAVTTAENESRAVDEAWNADDPNRPAPPISAAREERAEPLSAQEVEEQVRQRNDAAERGRAEQRAGSANDELALFNEYNDLYRRGEINMSFDEWLRNRGRETPSATPKQQQAQTERDESDRARLNVQNDEFELFKEWNRQYSRRETDLGFDEWKAQRASAETPAQPVAEQPAAPEQAPAQEPTEPPVAERSNRLRRNLKPNFRHQGENQQTKEIPNETGNVPVEAQPEPAVQDAGRGGREQAPQAAEGLVEGEAPRGEVPAAGEVAEERPAEAKPVAPAPAATQEQKPAEQKPVSKSDGGGQKLTGGTKEENTPQNAEATPPSTQTELPSAEPPKTAPASAPRAEGTTTPPQSAEPVQGGESAAGGATGGAAEEPKPTQGNKLRRGKKLEAQEPKADAAPATQGAMPERDPMFENEQLEKAYRMMQSGAEKDVEAGEALALDAISTMKGSELGRVYGMTPTDEATQKIVDIATSEVNDRMISDVPIPEGTIPDRKDTTPATPEAPAVKDNKLKPATGAKRGRKANASADSEAAPAPTTPAPAAAEQTQPASQFRDENGNMKKTLRGAVERIVSAIGNRTGKGAITPEEADAIVNGIAESPEVKHNRSARFFTPLVTDAEWQNSLGVDAESAKNLRDAVVRARDASQQKKQQRKLDNALRAADAGDKDAPTAYGLVRIASDALDKARTKGDKAAEARAQKALDDANAKLLAEYEQVPEANRDKFVKEQEKQFEEWSKKHDDVARNESVTADAPIQGKDGSSTTMAEQLPAKSTNRVGGRYAKGYVGEIKGVDGDEVHIAYYDADGKFMREEKVPLSTLRERGKVLKQYKELADVVEAKGEDAESTSVRFERAVPETPASRDAKFAADADYQRWLKSRKANDAEPLRQRYEMEQAKALGDAYQNAVRGVDFEYLDRDYDPAIDGGGDGRKSVGGIYTGTAADYANRSRRGGVDDGPSLRKIGSGAGSQVYGWGLYGSMSRRVADGYAKSGRENERPRLLHNGEEVPERPKGLQDRIMRDAFDAVHAGEAKNVEGYLQGVIDKMSAHEGGGDEDLIYFYKKYLDEYKANKGEWEWRDPKEFVYEQTFFTNRKPGDESHLLKWQERIGKDNLKRIAGRFSEENGGAALSGMSENMTGRDAYLELAKRLGSEKAASEFLARADIDGVKFRAGEIFGRRNGEENAYNYISFRDDNIRVDHKWEDGNLRYLRERGTGRVLGIFDRDTGKLKLFRGANWKTLNHELGGHATMRLAEQEAERGNRALLDKINEAVDGAMDTPLADEVRSRYPDADEATLRDEIWAALRERPSEAMQKYVKTLQGRKWYNRAWDAIKTAWRGILSRMGFNRADLSGIDKMTPDEFNEFLDNAMIGGKTLGRLETQGGDGIGNKLRKAFIGERGAKNLGIGKLGDAEQMEKDGASREDIWRKTGWWRAKDGKWRVEVPIHVSDIKSSFVPLRLAGLLDRISAASGIPNDRMGAFIQYVLNGDIESRIIKEIERREKWIRDYGKRERDIARVRREIEENKSVLQEYRDGRKFLEDVLSKARYDENGVPHVEAKLSDAIVDGKFKDFLLRAYPDLLDATIGFDFGKDVYGRGESYKGRIDITNHESANRVAGILAHEIQHEIQDREGFASGGNKDMFSGHEETRLEKYKSLAGEVESRNVERRLSMSKEERAATPPWETEDVPESEQIVRTGDGGGASESRGAPQSSVRMARGPVTPGPDVRIMDDEVKWLDRQVERFVDSTHNLRKVQGEVGYRDRSDPKSVGVEEVMDPKTGFVDWRKSSDIHKAIVKSNGFVQKNEHILQVRRDRATREMAKMKGLSEDAKRELVDDYLTALHAEERNRTIADRRGDTYNDDYAEGAGRSAKWARDFIANDPNVQKYKAELDKIADIVHEAVMEDLRLRHENGLLSDDEYNFYSKKWKHYVPLRTDMTEGSPESGAFNTSTATFNRSEYRTAKGRGADNIASSPFAFAFVQAHDGIGKSAKNIIGNVTKNFIDMTETKGLNSTKVEVVAKDGSKSTKTEYRIAEVVPADVVKRGGTKFAATFADGTTAEIGSDMRLASHQDNLVLFKRPEPVIGKDGKPTGETAARLYVAKFTEGKNGRGTAVAKAITGKNMVEVPFWVQPFSKATHFLSRMNTSASPSFLTSNVFNDRNEAWRAMSARFGVLDGAKMAAKVWKYRYADRKDLKNWLENGELRPGSDVADFINGGAAIKGGNIAQGFSGETSSLKDNLARQERKARSWWERFKRIGRFENVREIASSVGDVVQSANELEELGTRYGVYHAVLDELVAKGVPREVAKAEAVTFCRGATTDFNVRGTLAPVIGSFYMFYNANVQGTRRNIQSLTDKHGVRTFATLAGVASAMTVLRYWLGNDEEREKGGERNAKNALEYQKQSAMGIPFIGGRELSILKMRGVDALIPYAATKFTEAALYDDVGAMEALADSLKAAGGEALGVLGGNGVGNKSQISQTLAPSLADPFVQWATGTDWQGERRVKQLMDKTVPQSYNARHGTSDVFKWIAETVNDISGGNQYRKGVVDMAPEDVQLIVETLAGGLGRDITGAINTFSNVKEVAKGGSSERLFGRMPVVKSLVREYPDSTSRYFDALDEYNADKAEFKKTTELGRRAELKKAHPYLTAQKGRVDALIEQVQELTHRERGEVKVGQKWVPMKTELPEARKEAFRKRRLRLQAEVLRILGK